MIINPPAVDPNPFKTIISDEVGDAAAYLKFYSPVDEKGRYLHFDKMRFRIPKELDPKLVWSVVKLARGSQLSTAIHLGEHQTPCKWLLTPAMQQAISETDRHTTNAALEWMCAKVGEKRHLAYLLNDLVEDEAISSSQLEGAVTTTKVAKKILKNQLGPRSIDERMIVGNYKMMNFAWEKRNESLSLELISELHQIGVEGIDDERYYPGIFRRSDDVVVSGRDGEIVYTPPPQAGLINRLQDIIKWVSTDHNSVTNALYIHPLVKAIILHFTIGFEHPFHDGNGRVARSLFYWFMFKNEFASFRYIPISTLLKKAPMQYGRSYLYTESDDMDLTYFIEYQTRIVSRAINDFKNAYDEALKNIEQFNVFLYESGLYKKLSEKQKVVLQVAKNGVAAEFTASGVKENMGCSYNTASSLLNGLVDMKIFEKNRIGREWVFRMRSTKQIIENWTK